jgi:hypothetical protein
MFYEPKDPKLWRFQFPPTEYISLGEMLKEIWGQPASKVVLQDKLILLHLVYP